MKKLFILFALLISITSFAQNATKQYFTFTPVRMLMTTPDYKFVSYEVSVISAADSKNVQGPFVVLNGMQTKEAAKALGKARPGDKAVYEKIKVKELKTGKIIDAGKFVAVIH